MMLHCVALFDKKARAFARPFFVAHTDLAIRSVSGEVNQGAVSDLSRHPEDFSLYLMGTFDDSNGYFQLTAQPVVIVEAVALKKGATDV